jgi:hypothetical protein
MCIIYQVQIPESLQKAMKVEDKKQFHLNENELKQVKVELGIVKGVALYATEEYAKANNNAPTTINFIDHEKLTAKESKCVIA